MYWCATQALEKYNIEKDIAAFIKKEFDKKYNPTWHCIVGRNLGSYVTLLVLEIMDISYLREFWNSEFL